MTYFTIFIGNLDLLVTNLCFAHEYAKNVRAWLKRASTHQYTSKSCAKQFDYCEAEGNIESRGETKTHSFPRGPVINPFFFIPPNSKYMDVSKVKVVVAVGRHEVLFGLRHHEVLINDT